MSDFSWSRSWQSLWDVTGNARQWYGVTGRLAFVLALILAVPIAGIWAEWDFLTLTAGGRILWAVSILFAFLVGAQAVYKHRTELEELRNRAKIEARLSPTQRARIHEVKETAGRLHMALRGRPNRLEIEHLCQELQGHAARLLEHGNLAFRISVFRAGAVIELLRHEVAQTSEEGPETPNDEGVVPDMNRLYMELIQTANAVLEKYPA